MSAQPVAVARRIAAHWATMAGIYGHRWTSAYGSNVALEQPAPRQWAEGLRDIDDTQLAAAYDACRRGIATPDGWPPPVPEFRAICLGVPTIAAVRLELMTRDGTRSRFTRLVWSKLDGSRFVRADYDTADRLLRDAYALAREHVLAGGELPPEPVAALEVDEPAPATYTPEVARAHLDELRRRFGLSESEAVEFMEGSTDSTVDAETSDVA